jgi:hypothetical protein
MVRVVRDGCLKLGTPLTICHVLRATCRSGCECCAPGSNGLPNAYQAELSKRLLGNLQSLKHVEAAAVAPGDGKGGDAVVYELYVLRLM